MSIRTEQVGSVVKQSVQEVLVRGLKDPRIKGMITITRSTCSDDLRTVTMYISVIPEKYEDITLHGLTAAARHIRHTIADEIALSKTPKLMFRLDRQFKREANVLDSLAKVRREREELGEVTILDADDGANLGTSHERNQDGNQEENQGTGSSTSETRGVVESPVTPLTEEQTENQTGGSAEQ